jgi:hypothetical protein
MRQMSFRQDDMTEAELKARKRSFIKRVMANHMIGLHLFLIFMACWMFAWFVTATLVFLGVKWMVLRYAIAFGSSYVFFFYLVNLWISSVNWNDSPQLVRNSDFSDEIGSYGEPWWGHESSFWMYTILLFGAVLIGILTLGFSLLGGVAMFLEVVFEALFAGVIVRTLRGKIMLGYWEKKLFRSTWLPALIMLILLCTAAWKIQETYPQASTINEAVKAYRLQHHTQPSSR